MRGAASCWARSDLLGDNHARGGRRHRLRRRAIGKTAAEEGPDRKLGDEVAGRPPVGKREIEVIHEGQGAAGLEAVVLVRRDG